MPPPGAGVLEVRIESKAFPVEGGGFRQVLRDVSFCAGPGEVLALAGPSGIGKSTVLRIALGLDCAFTGMAHLPPGRTGVMFQEPRLLPWLTVAENLRLVLAGGERELDVVGILKQALLPDVSNLLPAELSLGMARRVAFARALAIDPDTLILDEPFASLDRQLASSLAAIIAGMARRRGTLVLLSTHDLENALQLAGRILVLSGSPATLAADIAVPSDVERDRLRQHLLSRFPFLGGADYRK